jgi:hypothetical protein
MALDRRTWADIAVTATPVTAIIFSVVVTGGAIVTIGSVVGVPIVVSVVVFVRWPGTQETPYRRVLLNRLIIFLLFWGGVVPIPRLIVVVVLVFQFPIEKELEILAIGQGLIVLWPSPEVPFLCIPMQRSAGLMSGPRVELRGHLPATLGCSGRIEGVGGWGGHGERKEGEMMQLLSVQEGDGCKMRRCEVK